MTFNKEYNTNEECVICLHYLEIDSVSKLVLLIHKMDIILTPLLRNYK